MERDSDRRASRESAHRIAAKLESMAQHIRDEYDTFAYLEGEYPGGAIYVELVMMSTLEGPEIDVEVSAKMSLEATEE
ncbi:MAG: hypothetical protein M3R38_17340 [Actinomycetota bacterium]|nr:hypothetical protein [Actinomycetota bacterium]